MDSNSNIKDKSDGSCTKNISLSSNGIISALRSKLNILKSSNFKVGGEDHSDVSIDSCSNVNVLGNKGCIKLEKISNTNISGNNNNVKISLCANINIRGDNNQVELSKISNHNLKPSPVSDTNTIEIIPQDNNMMSRSHSSITTNSTTYTNSKTFNVEYIGSANIHSPDYNLGIYSFRIDNQGPNFAEFRLNDSGLNILSVQSAPDNRSVAFECQNSNGTAQKLVVRGPRVTLLSENVYRVDM